jgi:hypothetical protein
MHDPTESTRRQMVKEINANPGSREALEAKHGQVWDTQELQQDFTVLAFIAPFVIVSRRSDGVKGSLEFQANERFYFNFQAD